MKNKKIVNQLKKLNAEEIVEVTITLAKKTLTEVCYHNGRWNDKSFTLDSVTNWRSAEIACEGMTVSDIIDILSKKEINDLSSDDFLSMSIIETTDGSTDIENLEWEEVLTEDEESEFSKMELYWDSDITDSDLQFEAGSILTFKIECKDFSTIIS